MNTWPDSAKLVELRSKTDRQLVELITRRLKMATSLARVAEFRGHAEALCEEVRRLLPYISRADRRHFEGPLQEIAEMLHPRPQAACF